MSIRLARRIVLLALLALGGVGVAVAATTFGGATVKAAPTPGYGRLLATASGKTLYHYTLDKRAAIACTGTCAAVWPPLLVAAGAKPKAGAGTSAKKLATVNRPDGTTQVTYAGLPLYRFSGDKQAHDVKGQGVAGKWFAVTPAGASAKATGSTPPPPSPPPTTTTEPTITYSPDRVSRAVGEAGAFVEFDMIRGLSEYDTRNQVDYVLNLRRAGFPEKILLSHDICFRGLLQTYGGCGYGHVLTVFCDQLREAGQSDDEFEQILVDNLRRALTGDV